MTMTEEGSSSISISDDNRVTKRRRISPPAAGGGEEDSSSVVTTVNDICTSGSMANHRRLSAKNVSVITFGVARSAFFIMEKERLDEFQFVSLYAGFYLP